MLEEICKPATVGTFPEELGNSDYIIIDLLHSHLEHPEA